MAVAWKSCELSIFCDVWRVCVEFVENLPSFCTPLSVSFVYSLILSSLSSPNSVFVFEQEFYLNAHCNARKTGQPDQLLRYELQKANLLFEH